jgi:hypothetical protein
MENINNLMKIISLKVWSEIKELCNLTRICLLITRTMWIIETNRCHNYHLYHIHKQWRMSKASRKWMARILNFLMMSTMVRLECMVNYQINHSQILKNICLICYNLMRNTINSYNSNSSKLHNQQRIRRINEK